MTMAREGRHPVDYEVHPIGGWFVLSVGLVGVVCSLVAGLPADPLRGIARAAFPISSILFGAALLRKPGPLRTWLLRGWLVFLAAWPILELIAAATN